MGRQLLGISWDQGQHQKVKKLANQREVQSTELRCFLRHISDIHLTRAASETPGLVKSKGRLVSLLVEILRKLLVSLPGLQYGHLMDIPWTSHGHPMDIPWFDVAEVTLGLREGCEVRCSLACIHHVLRHQDPSESTSLCKKRYQLDLSENKPKPQISYLNSRFSGGSTPAFHLHPCTMFLRFPSGARGKRCWSKDHLGRPFGSLSRQSWMWIHTFIGFIFRAGLGTGDSGDN